MSPTPRRARRPRSNHPDHWTRAAYVVDPTVARDLAVIADELFSGPVDPAVALSHLFGSDAMAVASTLRSACARLLTLALADSNGYPACTISDALAQVVVGDMWSCPRGVVLGQALLRLELDDGSSANLPERHLAALGAALSESVLPLVLAQLVLGLSALCAHAQSQDGAGDPLRAVLGVA